MHRTGGIRSREHGQILVIMAVAMIGLIALTALIIDGGNAWAHQRMTQNGTDAAAEAGAVVMAQRFAGAAEPAGGWDAAVARAVADTAAANEVTVSAAYYTDICGIPLRPNGSAALTGSYAYDFATAQRVGSGLPASVSTTPDCPSRTAGPAAGVIVLGRQDVATFLAGAVGINTMTVNTQATAAAGFLQESGEGGLLPIAIPVYVVTCDGQNNPVITGDTWSADGHTIYKVPMCKNGPGNVGWLDWDPPSGGTSDLINAILHPDNPPIPLPSWQYVSQTGNPNSPGVEDAIRTYDGRIVLIPQFDLTCNPGPGGTPNFAAVDIPQFYGCDPGDVGGNGQNQWYRMPSFANFKLCISTDPDSAAIGADHGAYLNGNNSAMCDSGNGATSCLVGKFVSIISTGTIGAGTGGGSGTSKKIGVQLIK